MEGGCRIPRPCGNEASVGGEGGEGGKGGVENGGSIREK